MSGVIGTKTLVQVGFVVKDIETTKRKFAQFFGVPVPEHFDAGKYEVTKTEYMGKPNPDANCLMAFFDAGEGVQIELIQPNGKKSVWQDFLDKHGEGFHHIAFKVKGMGEKIAACEEFGMKCVQRGEFGSGDGRYAYLDAYDDLKCLIELLESDK
mgnify:CR=1 FL=1